MSNDEIIGELYLGTLSRFPTVEERALLVTELNNAGNERRTVVEDIFWSVLNTKEFLFNNE